MPFYELLCITSHNLQSPEFQQIKELIKQTATHVLQKGGVIRGIESWGTRVLPQRMKAHRTYHQVGDYWTLHFHSSPRTIVTLQEILRNDPRVIRSNFIRLGSRVEEIAAAGSREYKKDWM